MGIIRKTKSVKMLLNVFDDNQNAVSVVQLMDTFKEYMNKTTVYRILERLEQEGIVHSFLGKGGVKWYAKCSECTSEHHSDKHPHFQCKNCGNVECLPLHIPIPNIANRQIDSVEIILQGTCPNCLS